MYQYRADAVRTARVVVGKGMVLEPDIGQDPAEI